MIHVDAMEAGKFSSKGLWRSRWVFTAAIVLCSVASGPANAQVDASKPASIRTKTPTANKAKFEGTVLHANIAQITVRGKDNEMVVRTFSLSREVSDRMQKIMDRGGYQYGDKVTVIYDPMTSTALKIKGKPSRPI